METNTAARSAAKGIHHVGADINLSLFARLKARAEEDGVTYAIVIRWALLDFLVPPAPQVPVTRDETGSDEA